MCGICGIVDYSGKWPVDEGNLNKMVATLAHRGPDEEDAELEVADGPVPNRDPGVAAGVEHASSGAVTDEPEATHVQRDVVCPEDDPVAGAAQVGGQRGVDGDGVSARHRVGGRNRHDQANREREQDGENASLHETSSRGR